MPKIKKIEVHPETAAMMRNAARRYGFGLGPDFPEDPTIVSARRKDRNDRAWAMRLATALCRERYGMRLGNAGRDSWPVADMASIILAAMKRRRKL